MKERRTCKRYVVHEDVLCIPCYIYRAKRVGKVRNISLTGLMCNCVHHNDCIPVDFDIFDPESSICLAALPYTIIETKSIESSPHFTRQCHVKFDPLPPEKILKLQSLIGKYTVKK